RHRVFPDLDVTDFGAGQDVDFPFLEAARELGAAISIFEGENSRKNFDQRDLGAKGGENVGELAADGARTNDRHGFRSLLENEGFVGRYDSRLVQLESDLREAFDARAGADDDGFFRFVLFLFAVAFDGDGVLAGQLTCALDPRDLVLLEEVLDALRVLIADSPRAFHRDAVIELHVPDRDAEVLGVGDLRGEGRRLEQRFRRDAAPEDAGAAESFPLDHGDGHTEL